MKPLIKWSGGKGDEIKYFEKYIPTYDTYIEPFVGGGSLLFHLEPKKAIISDVHNELIDLYNTIKAEKSNEIYNFMKNHKNDEENYYKIRDEFIPKNELERACKFYYLRKTCFRGMLRYNKKGEFNIPFGKYKKINFDSLQKKNYEEILKRTIIHNKDFSFIFEKYNDNNNFVFLDPPYDSKFTDYGYCKFGKEEHIKLFNYFETTKNKCLLIIGKTDFISKLYDNYIVDEYEKKYRFKIYSKRIGNEINNTHLVIKNFDT